MAVVPLLLLSGCWPLPNGAAVRLTETDNGGQVTLAVGEILTVTLASNPSTGYAWEIAALDQTVLKNTDNTYQSDCLLPVPGCGGREVWTFEGVAPGTTTLRMEYRRPWETDSDPAETFEVEVTVTE